MTKLYAPGDAGQAICPNCEKRVTTTYAYRDVPFDDGSGVVKGILAAVCDTCDMIVAIPAQSTPAIRRARDTADIPLEVNLLAPEIEVLDAAAFSIDPQSTTRFRKAIFTYYLTRFERDARELETAKELLNIQISARKNRDKKTRRIEIPSRRLSFKLTTRTERKMETVLAKAGWNKTSLVRGVLAMVEKDILEDRSPRRIEELQEIAEAVNA